MTSNGVDEDGLTSLRCRVNEFIDLVSHTILSVKQYLILLVHPVVGKICDSNAFPHVSHLVSCAIDDVCNLVGHYEF